MLFRELFAKEGLSLDRLRTLILVNDAGSIAAAAPDDRSRQSLYSRQINELEHFFSISLKRIQGRTARLTPAGRELALLARQNLADLNRFRNACVKQPSEVKIAAGDSLLQWLILPCLPKLQSQDPELIWHLHNEQNINISRRLLEQSLDFGLMRADLTRSELQSTSLGSFGYSLFIPNCILAPKPKRPLSWVLAELPIATQGDATLFQHQFEGELAGKKWPINIRLYCDSFSHVARAVLSGAYAGILPDYARQAMLFTIPVWNMPLAEDFPGLGREIVWGWNPRRLAKQPRLEQVRMLLEKHLRFPIFANPSSPIDILTGSQ